MFFTTTALKEASTTYAESSEQYQKEQSGLVREIVGIAGALVIILTRSALSILLNDLPDSDIYASLGGFGRFTGRLGRHHQVRGSSV